ncbi:MAG: DUF1573 domain-containing protein, partial [Akkermansiaceae bacterium]
MKSLLLGLVLITAAVFLGVSHTAASPSTKKEKVADVPLTGFTFIKNKVAVTAAPDATKVTVPYQFENKTDRTLTIAKYDSACSCLSAKVKGSKLVYKPGEKGEIRVQFAIGTFSGTVEKTVLLWTTEDPDDKPSTVMTVELTIPVLFEVAPMTLLWEQNEKAKAKTIKLKVNNDKPIRILEHSGSNKDFPYELKTIREGWEYELIVTPTST